MSKISKFLPCMRIRLWPILGSLVQYVRLFRAAHDLTSWPSGWRVRLWNLTTRVDSWMGTYYIVQTVFFFFSLVMQNYFIQVIWNYINDNKIHSLSFYIELCSKFNGGVVKLALLKDNLFGDPRFVFFFF